MIGFNIQIEEQLSLLQEILEKNETLFQVISKCQELGLNNYYIGAGCITQTVWNYQNGNDLMYGISDVDFVYYDDNDLSYEAESIIIVKVRELFSNSNIEIDVKNQARVHLWYKSHFGYDIHPYKSVEEAINTWPTTATAVGVRFESGKLLVYAPFGLNDMFEQIVRANKAQITEEIYIRKVEKWKAKWDTLKIIPW